MKTKLTIAAIALAAMSFAGGYAIQGNSEKPKNAILDADKVPAVNTAFNDKKPAAAVDFEQAVKSSVASVVHIKTLTKYKPVSRQQRPEQHPFEDFFGNEDFFKHFFDNDGARVIPEQRASGSGVIISSDGYIVTNNHVVDGATEMTVTLENRKDYTAKLIGTDPNTDLALIKIDAKNLPVINVGNSDGVRLGEWVLAIGYPLNLDITVTQGIVSGKSRNIGINTQGRSPIEAFIQTDAAVNRGSSGGALVNTSGELIGINTAIASPTGAYAGYSYSIPSSLMKKVIGDIMKFGSVQRAYLGISMAPRDLDDKAKKELGIDDNVNGIWVAETDPNGAAAEAGIKKGDAIIKLNGAELRSATELSEQIGRQKPGDEVTLTIVRDGKEMNVKVKLKDKMGSFPSQQAAELNSLGAEFKTLTREDAAKLKLKGGVEVVNISDGIIAGQTNMRPGFVITRIGNTPVTSVDDLKAALSRQGSNFQIEGVYPDSDEVYYYGINDFRQ